MDDKEINKLFVTINYYIHRSTTPSWTINGVNVDWPELLYVIKGQAEYKVNGVNFTVKKGDLLYSKKNSRRYAKTCQNDLMECYSVSGPVYSADFDETVLPFPDITHVGIHEDIISMYKNLDSAWVTRNPGYELKARGIYMMILQRFFNLIHFKENENLYSIYVKKAIEHIIENFKDNLSVEAAAKKAGLSSSYFGSIFTKETGFSYSQYLTNIRLNHAENLLKSGEYNVNEAAWACGFSDPAYFSKLFKKERGVPPSEIGRVR